MEPSAFRHFNCFYWLDQLVLSLYRRDFWTFQDDSKKYKIYNKNAALKFWSFERGDSCKLECYKKVCNRLNRSVVGLNMVCKSDRRKKWPRDFKWLLFSNNLLNILKQTGHLKTEILVFPLQDLYNLHSSYKIYASVLEGAKFTCQDLKAFHNLVI